MTLAATMIVDLLARLRLAADVMGIPVECIDFDEIDVAAIRRHREAAEEDFRRLISETHPPEPDRPATGRESAS